MALWTSVIVMVLSLALWVEFDPAEAGSQLVANDDRIASPEVP
jgi:hypothetical protein